MQEHDGTVRWRARAVTRRVRRSDGSATAELVVLLPAVATLLVVLLAGVQGVIANAAVVDASAAAARLAARGDPVDAALERFSSSGRSAHWTMARSGAFLCITVGIDRQEGVLISFPAEAETCVLAAG
jgi:Flp pilus assembly protein TadG